MVKRKICFLVGSMAISGGTYVIVQHAAYLQDQGYNVTLAVQEPFNTLTLTWHDRALHLRCIPIDAAKSEIFDLVIATWWKTALELQYFNSPHYAYFVQSIESRFYPEGEVTIRALVDSTYQLPINYVTEATWIKNYLVTRFGHKVTLIRNGIRKDIYRPTGPTVAPRDQHPYPRVLVEGHFGVSFKNTALGVRLAREAGAKNIWVLTGTPVKSLPWVSRVFSQVPMTETPAIYRSCDILIKLSTVEGMFGPPLEIFHCGGTAIVFDVTGHDEYIVDGQNACVVRQGDLNGVVTTLRHLLNDRDALNHLQAGALQTAEAWISWDESSAAFHEWIQITFAEPIVEQTTIIELTNKAFANYVKNEQVHQANKTWMLRHRQQLYAQATKLSPRIYRAAKQLQAASEILLKPREAK